MKPAATAYSSKRKELFCASLPKDIRYIAISFNEGLEKGLSDFVPFKDLINAWFTKDTDREVKIVLHMIRTPMPILCVGCAKNNRKSVP